ncbi:DUF819 domain-containing protein [Pedobacter sp. SL55]|uniref:DUF819 family protein n=1 Tax=Pedobacter sp. SL55 TaxID=2995161 RepID=UPI00226FDEC2|nr:DUF819 family protein [Pedobacter sp. SL55]WAC40387.1 DUF819 family protein [Pedobacter sp. SL55]
MSEPMITNDAVVLGILVVIIAFVFTTSSGNSSFFKKFYTVIPSVLLCYFIPGLLNTFGVISGEQSKLYSVMSRYLLPASLVLFTISLDFKEIWKLRNKAGVIFLTACISVIIGGPISMWIFSLISPDTLKGEGSDEVWRGLSTIAGSWIGGGANQAAMYETFKPSAKLYSSMITIDVIIANIWMAVLLYGATITKKIDRFLKSDNSAIDELKLKIERYQLDNMRIPSTTDIVLILAVGLGVTGFAHFLSELIVPWVKLNAPYLEKFSLTSDFFWMVALATMMGILLSFTKLRNLEGAGASRIATVFLYILIASIGMRMDVFSIFDSPGLLFLCFIWIIIHGICLLVIAKLTKTPFFFVAVNSQAVIGGAASAPIVASAFYPSLAPVGVLMAILGYATGTYGAYLCGLLMQMIPH